MRSFSSVADKLVVSQHKLRPELFQEIMISIQYRLLLLNYSLQTHCVEEALRVGLLAFQTSMFLQMHGTKIKYEFLGDRLRQAIQALPENSATLKQLKLWLAFVSSIAIVDSDEPWLKNAIRRLTKDLSWSDVRKLLAEVMWVGVLHDSPGKQVYEGGQVDQDIIDLRLQRFRTEFLSIE